MTEQLVNNTFILPGAVQATPKERLERSCKRSRKISTARHKNLRYSRQVLEASRSLGDCSPLDPDADYDQAELDAHALKLDTVNRLDQYKKNLCECSGRSLYRRKANSREATLITSLTCNHRLCNICNMLRANKMRRKWAAFFKSDERNVLIRKKQLHMFEGLDVDVVKAKRKLASMDGLSYIDEETGELTERDPMDAVVIAEPKYYTSGIDLLKNFDFMHLTLTVPHGPDGWNGKKYYAQELLQAFNEMRKAKWWLKMVFGGELSVETTKTVTGGLHIHIHAMILVDKRVSQSRNMLHEEILKRWNHLTIDYTKPEGERFVDPQTSEGKIRFDGISNSLGKPGDAWLMDWLLKNFDARGSSLIGLKSLYYQITPEDAANRKRKFEENGKFYAYASGRFPVSMVKGVMECLKYHFEPCVLETSTGALDTDFLMEVLPNPHCS